MSCLFVVRMPSMHPWSPTREVRMDPRHVTVAGVLGAALFVGAASCVGTAPGVGAALKHPIG